MDEMIAYLTSSLDDINMMVYVDKQGRLVSFGRDHGPSSGEWNRRECDVPRRASGRNLPDPEYARHRLEAMCRSASVRSGEYDGNRLADDLAVEWTPVRTAPLNFMYTATYTKDDGIPY